MSKTTSKTSTSESSSSKTNLRRRKSIRFKPDLSTCVFLDLRDPTRGQAFKPNQLGILIEEAYQGCGIVMASTTPIKKNQIFVIKVGQLAPMKAIVRWVKQLDTEVVRLGIEYIPS